MTQQKLIAIKMDLSKTYVRVEWEFLYKVIEKMGFSTQRISWIYSCISTVSFKILVDGILGSMFGASKGLIQGDPLSPILFIICVEGLSTQLRHKEEAKKIPCIRIRRQSPPISHLLFPK